MKANNGQKIPSLAIGGNTPYFDATEEEGKLYFDMEVKGLAKFAQKKLKLIDD